MDNMSLAVNALPFNHTDTIHTFDFYKEKGRNRGSLKQTNFPEAWVKQNPDAAKEFEWLYTDFRSNDEGDFEIEIDLDQNPYLADGFYLKKLAAVFNNVADFTSIDFIHRLKLGFRDQKADKDGFLAYKNFVLSIGRFWFTEGWGLSVIYQGHSYVYPNSLGSEDEILESAEITGVLYKRFLFHHDDIPEEKLHEIDFQEVYPVVNMSIRQKTGKFLQPNPFHNKLKEYHKEIDWFKNKFLTVDGIKNSIGIDPSKWACIPAESAHKIPNAGSKMVFRQGKTDINPHTGISKHGPYRPPVNQRINFLFIMNEMDKHGAGKEFFDFLKGRKKMKGIKQYLNLGVQLGQRFIYFTDDENPYPEIMEQVMDLSLDPAEQYLAFYISPIESGEKDPEKHLIYYRLKEELLKRHISLQVVERSTITGKNFHYALPNIYVAAFAKLNGIPWQLSEPPEPELIVGVGAFKKKSFKHRYLGSAFCFRNNGTFTGLRCFSADETHMLAGSVREAVTHYVKENDDVKRLVIHFYKTMSRKERKPIMYMLQNLGLDIPVIVLTINKTEFEDTVLFDLKSPHRLPLSGTYFYRSKNDVLLCNNTRYFANSKISKGFSFPVRIQMWCSDEEYLNDHKVKQTLLTQVYQFSRLYWKSVSQQNLPVTIKYPEMVAEIFPYFSSLTLPQHGRSSLWFL